MAEVQLCGTSTLLEWKEIFVNDLDLFSDLSNKRASSEVGRLVKRLKGAQKCLGDFLKENKEISLSSLRNMVETIVDCLWSSAENVRLGREIEKLLALLWHHHSELVSGTMEAHLCGVIHGSCLSHTALTQVSGLLDLGCDIRSVIQGKLPMLLETVQATVTRLTAQGTPNTLSLTDHQLLYASVKVTLQIFQNFPQAVSVSIWPNDGLYSLNPINELQPTLNKLLAEMFLVLRTPGFSSETVLLTGTAVVFLLNTAPSIQAVGEQFWMVFHTYDGERTATLGRLQVNLGELPIVSKAPEKCKDIQIYGLGHLSLLRGFVTSAATTTLLHNCGDNTACEPNILKLFDPILTLCNGSMDFKYLAFQLMSKWFQKVLHILQKFPSEICQLSLKNAASILEQSWDLVRLNCESPVDSVADFSIEICKMLLDFEKLVKCSAMETTPANRLPFSKEIANDILQHVTTTTWTGKSRYKLLKILMPILPFSKVVLDYPGLIADLTRCLSTSNLAVCASDVYRASLVEAKSRDEDLVSFWTSNWWEFIKHAITSDISLLRHNCMIYLMPTTVKTAPELSNALQSQVFLCLESASTGQDRNLLLLAWVSVMKIVRSSSAVFEVTEEPLSEAIFHAEEDIRSAAISLVCSTLKTAEPVSMAEETMLKKVLPLNLSVDSAAFRQRLVGDVKKLVVRCRDSALASIKAPLEHKDFLGRTLDFVDWLLKLCMSSLLPGVSFQRRKTCLEIYQVLLEEFTKFHESKHKKGHDQESMHKLMALATERNALDFFSQRNWIIVLHCVLDGTDEVQNLSSFILMTYFPRSAFECQVIGQPPEGAVCELLSHGLRLCNTAWSPNNNSGCQICQLVCKRFMCEVGWRFDIKYNPLTRSHSVDYAGISEGESVDDFLEFLVSDLTESIELATQSPLEAAETRPIQGMFSLLNALLSEKFDICQHLCKRKLDSRLDQLTELCLQTSRLMAAILAGGEVTDSCVSFVEIAHSLENLVPHESEVLPPTGNLENPSRDTWLTSSSYRPLLTWCANITKESMVCLGRVSELLVSSADRGEPRERLLQRLGHEFVAVFTRNRHWGAIDGCRLGFVQYCTALFSSSQTALCSIPMLILKQVLAGLTSGSGGSSVTRRSAGLPVLIQAIITSERPTGRTECLWLTMETLLSVASAPLPGDCDQTQDLPQVHALNMLNTIFTDMGLVNRVVTHVSPALVLVVNSFSSQSWAIRNAALQLFSTLISRVFGQRKNAGHGIFHVNSLTVSEFAAHYPELCPLIVSKLEGAARGGLYSITKLPTSLFPVLTILSHLAPQMRGNSFPESVTNIVRQAAYSPVYSLRVLASRAYPALLKPSQRQTAAKQLLTSLRQLDNNPGCRSANYLHGALLQIEKLLETEDERRQLMTEDVLNGLLDADWMMCDPRQSCGIVKAKYLEVVRKCCDKLNNAQLDKKKLRGTVDRCLMLTAESEAPDKQQVDVGNWLCREQVVHLLVTAYDWTFPDLQEKMYAFISDSPSMRPACLSVLKQCLQPQHRKFCSKDVWHNFKSRLFKYVCCATKDNISDLSECLDLIVNIHEQYGLSEEDLNSSDLALVTWSNEVELCSTLSAQILEVSAIAILKDFRSGIMNCPEAFRFCETLLACSKATATEHHQMAAARSLSVPGRQLLVAAEADSDLEALVPLLIETTLNLLHNSQPEVRAVVGKFICSLPWKPALVSNYSSLQTSMCIQTFCEIVSSKFSWSKKCVRCLIDRLYQPGDVNQLCKQSLFFTDSDLGGRELCVEAKYLHKTLKRIFVGCPRSKLTKEYLTRVGENLSLELKKCCQFTNSQAHSIFSPLTTPAGIICIIRLLLTSDLLIQTESPVDFSIKQTIEEHALQLKQVPSLTSFFEELETEYIASATKS